MVRIAVLTPLVAIRYCVQNVLTQVGLVTIPWQAQLPPLVRPPDYFQSRARPTSPCFPVQVCRMNAAIVKGLSIVYHGLKRGLLQ
jgi:hypothetical protein